MLLTAIPRIVGVGLTPLSQGGAAAAPTTPVALIVDALNRALADASAASAPATLPSATSAASAKQLSISDLDGLIALPALMGDQHFMMGHAAAAAAGLFSGANARARGGRGVVVRTLDVGGAG